METPAQQSKPSQFISVATTFFVVATLSLSAQSYIGPYFSYGTSTSGGTSVAAHGLPSRITLGALYSRAIGNNAEINVHGLYRIESGGEKTLGEPLGLNVTPGHLITTMNSTAIELGASLALRVAALDSSGSAIQLLVGVYGDRLFSVKKTEDYSDRPNEEWGTELVIVNRMHDAQVGFGVVVGARMVLPVDARRIVVDLSYIIVRRPASIFYPDWLAGSGIRLGVGFQF